MREAQSLVEDELERSKCDHNPIDCVILEEQTIEKSWGWVFFYQSKAFVETGEFRKMLGGNAPIIVNRNTGELFHTGTAHDIEHYINQYETALLDQI